MLSTTGRWNPPIFTHRCWRRRWPAEPLGRKRWSPWKNPWDWPSKICFEKRWGHRCLWHFVILSKGNLLNRDESCYHVLSTTNSSDVQCPLCSSHGLISASWGNKSESHLSTHLEGSWLGHHGNLRSISPSVQRWGWWWQCLDCGFKISRYLFSCVFVVPLYLHNTHIFDHHVWKMVGSWLAGILVGWICCPRDATNPLLAAASPLSGSEYSVPWPLIWRSKVLFASFALVLLLCLSYGSYGEPWNAVISSWVLTLCDGLFGGFLIALSWMTDSRCMSMVMKMAKSTTVMIGILWHIVIKKGTRNVIHS